MKIQCQNLFFNLIYFRQNVGEQLQLTVRGFMQVGHFSTEVD
jgi:hypothetical protein